ncbi:IS3 family transposase [Cytobacillus praedii]|uniref:IS3 family transposase n=1 Tax=Cytobacillus praedii TaxID=1742358 RepID=UPI003AF96B73
MPKKVASFSDGSGRLSRKAQTALSFELKEEFRLKDVLRIVGIPESSYHYHVKQMKRENPNQELGETIQSIFEEHNENYGYRRIQLELKNRGIIVNHKKVQRIMRELGLKGNKFTRKSRRYSSYKGTIGTVVKNRIHRRFNTTIPCQKLTTDITEFKCTDGLKLYLSPMMDMYNGEILSYGIGMRPTLDFVMKPLDEVLDIVKNAKYRTTIHSDQGLALPARKMGWDLKRTQSIPKYVTKGELSGQRPHGEFLWITETGDVLW